MRVRKAVVPCAGYGTRFLPWTKACPKELLPLADKPVLEYILEEAKASGIEKVLLITSKGKTAIEDYFDRNKELEFLLEKKNKLKELEAVRHSSEILEIFTVRQPEALGLGHAVSLAEAFVGEEPFLVLLPDNPVETFKSPPASAQLIEVFERENCSVVGVQEVKREETNRYGIISGEKLSDSLWSASDFFEKPDPKDAPSCLAMLGRYVFTPRIFHHLKRLKKGAGGELQLTDAIKTLLEDERVLAKIYDGKTYDTGNPEGYLCALFEYAKRQGYNL